MIIKFPTGLYSSELPNQGNITWYISSNEPPRSSLGFMQVPIAEEIRPAPGKIYTKEERREAIGQLAFTINEPSQADVGTSRRAFTIGQILDFEEGDAPDLTLPSGERLETRHNMNMFDLSTMGLTEEEIDKFNEDIENKESELQQEYDIKRTSLETLRAGIRENQKSINETTSTIDTATIVGDDNIVEKLTEHRSGLIKERDQLATKHEELVAETEELKDQIRQVRQMVL